MTTWTICFFVGVCWIVLGAVGVIGISKMKKKFFLSGQYVFAVGVAAASVAAFYPLYEEAFTSESLSPLNYILLSVHNTIRLFVVDCDYTFVSENVAGLQGWLSIAYPILMAVLYVMAPVMTFGFVLSFFKNLSAYKNMLFKFSRKAYVFSELNDRSLAFAKNLKKEDEKCLIIFTDVFEKNEECSYELREKADEIKAVCFKKDISSVNFKLHNKNSEVKFFLIGENDDENIKQTYELVKKYNKNENMAVYLFSTSAESGFILNTLEKGKMTVRRVDTVRSLIGETLYKDGYENIFKSAAETNEGYKKISALVIGMGQHGTEMAKALPWFCQMDGYRAYINCFDLDEKAKSRFEALCPELCDAEYNNNFDVYGEAQYSIEVHPKIDAMTDEFYNELDEIGEVTYVFVALGNDGLNIQVATNLRSYFAKKGYNPKIQAVVYSSDKRETFKNIKNFSGDEYEIELIGDLNSTYSIEVIMNSDLENKCISRHRDAKSTEDFWNFEYNYRSSTASVMHQKMKALCGIPAAKKLRKDRTPQEIYLFSVIEHRRWNAYMRSEGYCHGEEKNHLAKTHHCLIDFDKLSPEDQAKDNYEVIPGDSD